MARKKRRSRERGAEKEDQVLFVRVSESLLAQIDNHLERLRRRLPGARLNRSDAVRGMLERALKEERTAEEPGGQKGRRSMSRYDIAQVKFAATQHAALAIGIRDSDLKSMEEILEDIKSADESAWSVLGEFLGALESWQTIHDRIDESGSHGNLSAEETTALMNGITRKERARERFREWLNKARSFREGQEVLWIRGGMVCIVVDPTLRQGPRGVGPVVRVKGEDENHTWVAPLDDLAPPAN